MLGLITLMEISLKRLYGKTSMTTLGSI